MKWFKSAKDFFQTHIFNELPYYYQHNDTYKDSEGKGILERFIGVCANYFDTEVMPDIDNFMDCLDVDRANPIFLNYIWEYFGFFPYSYGIITHGEPYTKENFKKWMKESRGYPASDYRKILKYAISLYKIRGTKKFYEILGRLYFVKISLVESITNYEDQGNPQGNGNTTVRYDVMSHFDTVGVAYDTETDCWECVPVLLTISIPSEQWDYLMGKDREIQDKLIQEWIDSHPEATQAEIEEASNKIRLDHPSDFSDKVKNTFVDIVNKYLPVNVEKLNPNDSNRVIFQSQERVTLYIK